MFTVAMLLSANLNHRPEPLLPHDATQALQQALQELNEFRLRPCLPSRAETSLDVARELHLRREEAAFLERERMSVAAGAAAAPTHPDAFVAWFEELKRIGPGQNDPLFPWLAEHASLEQIRWFLGQEVAGEAGFEDLLALTQVKMPPMVKLEMARNFWDEMGQGHQMGMHGPLLEKLARALDVKLPTSQVVWESLALSNLMAAFACNRRFAFHSVGALGVIELTAPGRAALVNAGLKRLQVEPVARKYFALHATLDVQHSLSWNREVLRPLVAGDPHVARALAEGALMRLRAGERCFARYKRQFGLMDS